MDHPGGVKLNTIQNGKMVVITPVVAPEPPAPRPTNPGELEARQWIDCIKNDTDLLVLPEQAYVVTKITDAIYRSATTGETVQLK